MDELGYLVMNFDHFLTSQSNTFCNRSSIVPKLAELIVNFGLIKTFDGAEDRGIFFLKPIFIFVYYHDIYCCACFVLFPGIFLEKLSS